MIRGTIINTAINVLIVILLAIIIYYLVNIGNKFISERKRIKIRDKRILSVLLGLLCIFVLYNIFKKYTIVSDTAFTIILSAIIAYLFNPIIDYFESKNIKRVYGVLILYLSILVIIFILAFLVVPKSGRELKRLATDMPKYIENISAMIDIYYTKYTSTMGDLPDIFQGIQEILRENLIVIENIVVNGLKNFFSVIMNVFSKVVSIVLTPILTFYFLVDKDYFTKKIKKLIPRRHREKGLELTREIDGVLSKFVRGKLILASYVGIVTSIFLLIMGVDFAIFIGFITGIADIVPYIGPFIGFIPAFFFALLVSPIKALWVSIFFVLIQWVENNILAPKIIGDTIGMHPMVILLSIIIGGGVFGILGMILAIPAVAVSILLFNFFKDEYKKSKQIS